MSSDDIIAEVIQFFLADTKVLDMDTLGQGKVNDTWLLSTDSGEKYVLQRLPVNVFPDPEMVMHNFRLVTRYMRAQVSDKAFLNLKQNHQGNDLYLDEQGNGYRLCEYIDNSLTFERLDHSRQGHSIGFCLGQFHLRLAHLEHHLFLDPLPNFHNTLHYLQVYDETISEIGTLSPEEMDCIEVVEQQRNLAHEFDAITSQLTRIIIHGDPKVSNFLFQKNTDQVMGLIDLDTVKPGFLLHDLADCLRSCCNFVGEEPPSQESVSFCPVTFNNILHGYFSVARHLLNSQDVAYLLIAARLICFELGLRFFTDHLQQDVYFKTTCKGQNLERAMVQFQLASSINAQLQDLEQIVQTIAAKDYQPNH